MCCRWGAIRGRVGRTCGVQGRFVESIDPNQGIEGCPNFQTQESREEKAGPGQVKRSEGDVANEL